MPSLFLGLTDWITSAIAAGGYPAVFLLMAVEGILTPIPSEFILPFAGYLAARGEMNLVLVIAVGTAGAAVGNTVAYQIGARVGRPLVSRYGRFIALDATDLEWAEAWFRRWGDLGILLGHAVPGVRSIISFPAGIGRMRLRNFIAYSTAGAALWNTVLVVSGYLLVDAWRTFAETTENVDVYIVAGAASAIVGYVYYRKWRTKRRTERPA